LHIGEGYFVAKDEEEQNNITYVYVMYNEERNRCKIGKANNPKKRLADLQTGSVDDLEITYQQPVDKSIASSVERLAHKIAVEAGKKKAGMVQSDNS
jgi:predicted GIY-YIG superfamily endonuclease